jgi:DNA-binding SARP family transcriptional activator
VIHLLGASLVVEVDARRRPVHDRPGKLLVALALAHPTPVHVEQAADLLWPGLPLDQVRRRLNTVVHRLRRALAPHGQAVIRGGDLLGLDGDDVTVDLVAYRAALTGAPALQQAALAAVRGNLCHAQFPYDEWFVGARQRFVAEWVVHARRLGARLHPGAPDLGGALAALDLGPEDIDATHPPTGPAT